MDKWLEKIMVAMPKIIAAGGKSYRNLAALVIIVVCIIAGLYRSGSQGISGGSVVDEHAGQGSVAIGAGAIAGGITNNQGIITQGQTGGTNIINQAPKPELRVISKTTRDNPDGSYSVICIIETGPRMQVASILK